MLPPFALLGRFEFLGLFQNRIERKSFQTEKKLDLIIYLDNRSSVLVFAKMQHYFSFALTFFAKSLKNAI